MNKLFTLMMVILLLLLACKKEEKEISPDLYQWEISNPAAEGMNPEILDSAFIRADELNYVDAVLVVRNGKIVAERYYNGYDQWTPHNLMSVTKSFMSAITGIAFHDGVLDDLDKKIMDYFPDYVYSGMDQRLFDVTVRHLLTMRMGIDIEENNLLDVMVKDDWNKATFELPLLYNPGEKFAYNSLQTHLLSAIIARSSDMTTLDFANKYLCNPIGVNIDFWIADPKGINNGGFNMLLAPRDMAVFGLLYMNGGELKGKQVVPADWIDASLTGTWAKNSSRWGVLTDYNYGYLWWLGKINGYDMFFAMGLGGQYILNFPELDLIIVTTAKSDVDFENGQEMPILEMVSKFVLPSVN